MPCRGGYRKNIDASKVRYEEGKKYRESPEHKHWLWLVDQVYRTEDGFAKLSRENQLFFATNLVIGEVYNGGFDQYFRNSSADYFNFAVEGLITMKASTSLALLMSAKTLIFGDFGPPSSTSERRKVLHNQGESRQVAVGKELEKLDKDFWANPDQLSERMTQFAKEHDLLRNF
jgi:hypothetical protein